MGTENILQTYFPVVIVGDVSASKVRLKGPENVRSLGYVNCQGRGNLSLE